MIAFEFATATRILFGAGQARELGTVARSCGHRALVVIGQTAGAVRRDFLARHPNAVVDQRDSLLTLEPAGTSRSTVLSMRVPGGGR